MVQILITFDIRAGLEEEYGRFVEHTGMSFWRDRPGIAAVRGFRNVLGGSPHIVAEVDCESLEAACDALSSPEYQSVLREQARFVTDRSVWLLTPTGRAMD
jgi:hypothetical protein